MLRHLFNLKQIQTIVAPLAAGIEGQYFVCPLFNVDEALVVCKPPKKERCEKVEGAEALQTELRRKERNDITVCEAAVEDSQASSPSLRCGGHDNRFACNDGERAGRLRVACGA